MNQTLTELGGFEEAEPSNPVPVRDSSPLVNRNTVNTSRVTANLGNANSDYLSLSDRGEQIERLQANLQELDLKIPQNELEARVFGVGTRQALKDIQIKYDLKTTGVFDLNTQKALEKAIAENNNFTRRLEGRIISQRGLPAGGIKLRVYHRGFGENLTLYVVNLS